LHKTLPGEGLQGHLNENQSGCTQKNYPPRVHGLQSIEAKIASVLCFIYHVFVFFPHIFIFPFCSFFSNWVFYVSFRNIFPILFSPIPETPNFPELSPSFVFPFHVTFSNHRSPTSC
jgi:hypothetical protein